MAINLTDIVQKYLTGPVTRQISSLLGESEATTQAAISAAVPATIGALMKQASTPSGARELSTQLDRTDTSILGNLAGSLTGAGKSVMDTGANLANNIFGSQLGSLQDGLSRVTGMGKGAISSLLALVTPIVMGALSKLKRDQGLDASGLSAVLDEQSGYLANLLPAGLADTLGISSKIGAAGAKARATVERVGGYAADAGGTPVRATQKAASEGSSFLRRIAPFAALIALVLIVWAWMSNRPTKPVEAAPAATSTGVQSQLTGFVDSATSALRGVTDVESAKAAVPKLESAAKSIDALSGSLGSMTATVRSSIDAAATMAKSSLKTLADKALAIPGVREVLEPAWTNLTKSLDKLSA